MKTFAPTTQRASQIARLGAIVATFLFLVVLIAPTVSMQEGGRQAQVAGRVTDKLSRAGTEEAASEPQAAAILAPETITLTSYPFTSGSGVALEDMSSGTTQLVAASQDDIEKKRADIELPNAV